MANALYFNHAFAWPFVILHWLPPEQADSIWQHPAHPAAWQPPAQTALKCISWAWGRNTVIRGRKQERIITHCLLPLAVAQIINSLHQSIS